MQFEKVAQTHLFTIKNVSADKALVEEDGRYSVDEIANKVGISEESAHEYYSDQKFGNEKGMPFTGRGPEKIYSSGFQNFKVYKTI